MIKIIIETILKYIKVERKKKGILEKLLLNYTLPVISSFTVCITIFKNDNVVLRHYNFDSLTSKQIY